jgi:hypothetical protein
MDRSQNNPIGALKMISELMPAREQIGAPARAYLVGLSRHQRS